jgi:Xaa-Pro dipeptidase
VAAVTREEIDRRYRLVREAMDAAGLDAVVIAGSEYTGFEGAVAYMSGFQIVHRYAYVLLPRDGEPSIAFPAEARYVGEHRTSWIEDQEFVERPGAWLGDRVAGLRVGVYGLDYVMTVRDFVALSQKADVVRFDVEFDLARAVKSELEVDSVRESVRINTDGFWAFLDAFAPGKTAAAVIAQAERLYVERGCGRSTMNMVLVGAEFVTAREEIVLGEFCIPSLEIAGPGGHWTEVSRAIGPASAAVAPMLEAYEEYFTTARTTLRPGAAAHDVHRAVAKSFLDRGYTLGHVTGHSIGMTMIEHPKIGEGVETELRENMVFAMHPHAITQDGKECLYMQDTWLVTPEGGEPLAGLPMRLFAAGEVPAAPFALRREQDDPDDDGDGHLDGDSRCGDDNRA